MQWKDNYAKQLLLTHSVYSENIFSMFYESLTKILSYLENSVCYAKNIQIGPFLINYPVFLGIFSVVRYFWFYFIL